MGDRVSPTGGKAGINRRVLLAADNAYFQQKDVLPALFEPFGCPPERLADPDDLTIAGGPLYRPVESLPPGLALMDTPDFDTGAGGTYTNRQAARQALEASDIIIYIFTNSNYSNRDNTDFIAQMLTGIGLRKCFLVYRVYPSFQESEVMEHAMTVARNIYGDDAEQYLLGVYRADEDNAVAAGRRFMTLKPTGSDNRSFTDALKAVDAHKLRMELNASILQDALTIAGDIVHRAKTSMEALQLYANALHAAQSRCTHEALQHFPMDFLVRRFAEIWMSTDPAHIRFMRKTGGVLEWPVKMVAKAVKQARGGTGKDPSSHDNVDYATRVKEDLIRSVNELHMHVVGPEISVSIGAQDPVAGNMVEAVTRINAENRPSAAKSPHFEVQGEKRQTRFVVPAHPAVYGEQEKIINRDWNAALQSIFSRSDEIVGLSEKVEKELFKLADDFRNRMGVWDKLRQSFSAFLNVLPATAAITYILHTGDPVGATGIKVKLTGLFGLQDLYALIALPATSGMKKADHAQLESLLEPIAQTWLHYKVEAVQQLFEQEITGEVLGTATQILDESDGLIQTLSETLARISRQNLPEESA